MYLTIALAIFGLFGIGYGIYSLRQNWRSSNSETHGLHSHRNVIMLLIIGAFVGAATWPATYFMGYPVRLENEVGRVVGLPFLVAYFDAGGADFVGPLTMPAVFANFVFWFLLPQTVLHFVWKWRR